MSKLVCTGLALSCALLFAPLAPAMQRTRPQAGKKIDQQSKPARPYAKGGFAFPLDYEQLERLRIELLERGFNPGFDPGRGPEIEPQLVEALAQFQMEYSMPVTGEVDGATLDALNVPTEKQGPAPGQSPQRAKPSR